MVLPHPLSFHRNWYRNLLPLQTTQRIAPSDSRRVVVFPRLKSDRLLFRDGLVLQTR